jgi:hypothetical protein
MNKLITKQNLPQLYLALLDGNLLNQEDQKTKAYQLCLEFLRGVEKTRHMNRFHTSYGYKHLVEGRPHRGYVYEGTFVMAALDEGFTMKRLHPLSIKALFNISERSLKRRLKEWSPRYPCSI